jgi:hypothetical protein
MEVCRAMDAAVRLGSTPWPVTWPNDVMTSRAIDYWRSVKKGGRDAAEHGSATGHAGR